MNFIKPKLFWRWTLTTLLMLIVGIMVVACHTYPSNRQVAFNSTHSDCRVVSHKFGLTQICGQPQRLIALDTQSLDLLLSLGLEPVGYAEDKRALVGTPRLGEPIIDIKYLNTRLNTLPTYVGTAQSPSLETILLLKPDLIITSSSGDAEYQVLNKIAPTLLPLDFQTPDQWRTGLRTY